MDTIDPRRFYIVAKMDMATGSYRVAKNDFLRSASVSRKPRSFASDRTARRFLDLWAGDRVWSIRWAIHPGAVLDGMTAKPIRFPTKRSA